MPFLDKLFRFKKKPFGGVKDEKKDKGAKISTSEVSSASSKEKGSGAFAHVLLRPHTSEKAVGAQSANQYIFEVALDASKQQVAQAIQDLYGTYPEAVNIVNVSGKHLRFGKTSGRTKGWKKAIVKLPQGKTIDVYKQ